MKRLMLLFVLLTGIVNGAWLGEFDMDDWIAIHATTSRFTTGAAFTTADAQFTIYEMLNSDGTISTTEVVTATNMTEDFDGQTGLHVGSVELSAGNGFNAGNMYIVSITATVDSVAAVSSDSFRIRPGIVSTLVVADNIGINWADVSNQGTAVDLSGTDIQLTDTVTTYTSNTPQTGDSFAIVNSGTIGNAVIEGQTDDIGVAGVGLTDLGGMSTGMQGEVQSEANDALVANLLDHLLAVADADDVVDNSVIAHLASATGDWSTFDDADDSHEATRDQGDAAWTTGSGTGLTALATGTAQSGTASTIVLAGASAFADDVLNGNSIKIHTGTGAGQARVIISNTLSDDTCNISPDWEVNPGADSEYEIVDGTGNVEVVRLEAPADLEVDTVLLTDGTGAGEIDLDAGAVVSVTTTATTTDVTNTVSADIVSVSGDTDSANNLELDYDGTGYAKANSNISTCTTVGVVSGNVNGNIGGNIAGDLAGSIGAMSVGALSDFVNVDTTLTHADVVSGSIIDIQDTKIDRNADLVESQRGFHTAQGDYYYVDPVNGDTHANGNRGGRADPYLTIQDCHDNAVTAWNHDVIFLLAGDTNSSTTHTVAATTTISKAYTFIRGPGRDFFITRTGNGDTIEITAGGVEISGVQIGTAATGSGDGIQITDTDFTRIRNCWFLDTRGDGIQGTRVSNLQIHDNHFEGTGVGASGEGIHIDGTGVGNSMDNVIRDNHFADTGGDSILIENGTIIDTSIERNVIHGAGGWGINISADSTDAILADNIFNNNTSGDIQNNGVTSGDHDNDETRNLVWNAINTGATYNIPTSTGRQLRDISSPVIITGTSPGGGGNQSIILDGDASAVDGTYDPGTIIISGGTGMGQSRQIMEYDGSTKTAYLKRDWKVNPDNTSTYTILASAGDTHVNEGLAQAGGATSITLNALASAVNDTYNGQTVFLVSGTGQDQARTITAYNGTSKVATVATWQTNPDGTTVYIMLPIASSSVDNFFDEVIEGGQTYRQITRVNAAVMSGLTTMTSTSYSIEGIDGVTTRLAGALSAGSRTTVTTRDGD